MEDKHFFIRYTKDIINMEEIDQQITESEL